MAIAEIAEEANVHTAGMLSEAGGRSGATHAPLSGQHAGTRSPTAGQSVPGMTAHCHQGARLLLQAAPPAAAAVTAAAAVVDHRPQAQTVAAAVEVTAVRNERHMCSAAEEAQQSSEARPGQQPVAPPRTKAFPCSSSSSSSQCGPNQLFCKSKPVPDLDRLRPALSEEMKWTYVIQLHNPL